MYSTDSIGHAVIGVVGLVCATAGATYEWGLAVGCFAFGASCLAIANAKL